MAAPIQADYRDQMNAMAAALDEAFNGPRLPGIPRKPKVGFCLLSFEFGKTEGGRVNYISNGERADMIAAMHEWLARAEGRYHEGSEARQ
jgi:hypothetical protein